LLATLTELTARTVADGIEAFLAVRQPVDEVVVSGGGAHNLALMERLRAHLGDSRLAAAGEITAIPGDAKEAVAFALIAHETLAGRPGNVPAATGAAGPRVLGVVVPAGEGKG
jgi:anhydro-N-acetylmuramic acid kinase